MTFTTRMRTPQAWDDFAALVEAYNGVWGADEDDRQVLGNNARNPLVYSRRHR